MYNDKIRLYNLGDSLYSLLIVLMLMGYPIFSILATILHNDNLTIMYRGLCLLVGILVLIMPCSCLESKNKYSITQLLVVAIHIIYLSWVFTYFSRGYHNENLDLSFYINNSLLFSLLPVMFLTKNVTYEFYPLLKKHIKSFVIIFIIITFYGYAIGLSDEYRLSFEKINPISLCLFAAIASILTNWAFETKLARYSVILLLMSIMVLSGSRGPVVALIAVVALYIFFQMRMSKKLYFATLGIVLISLVGFFYDSAVEYIPILSRFNFATTEGGLSVNIREEQYKSAIDIFINNPFFGNSLVEHFANFYPHNIILEILITGGVTLFVIYLLVFIFFISELINASRRHVPTGFIMVFFLLFIAYMFTSSLAGIGLLYFTIVLISKMNVGE